MPQKKAWKAWMEEAEDARGKDIYIFYLIWIRSNMVIDLVKHGRIVK